MKRSVSTLAIVALLGGLTAVGATPARADRDGMLSPYNPNNPTFAYTGDPAYRRSRGYYAPGYDAYAYAPGYRTRVYRRGYANPEVRSVPRHYDPGAGYNSNTIAPWQDWKLQGNDY